jgi:hypothetical protein
MSCILGYRIPALALLPNALVTVLRLLLSSLAPFVVKESSLRDLRRRGKNAVY